ncbi:MAG: peptidoglycan-binding protein [Clostridia bacterium]|nr:peptidoglycan-binding protein [Clostridia bacterium]
MPTLPYIPETITVHLGPPESDAANVTVSFPDYIKNVASSEIYPTWPDNALRANIYAQISFALNRIYTEYYRSRGYDFDITNSTAIDQSFVAGRDIFENISEIVDEIFSDYLRRAGQIQPLYAQYCSGTTVTCDGLSQWGSVDLAERGYTPYQILSYYYGDDLEIVTDAPVMGQTASLPPYPLRLGSTGDDVRTLQIRLNRIGRNYPSIPKIPAITGLFSYDTDAAVRRFQEIFDLTPDGVVGRATWYKIGRIYAAVKQLNTLNAEGIAFDEVSAQFPEVLRPGSSGIGVRELQYYLRYLSAFSDEIPPLDQDGIYGRTTEAAVRAFQRLVGLPIDGIVGEDTWNAIYRAYLAAIAAVAPELTEGAAVPYPGVPLVAGVQSEEVRLLQTYLARIAEAYPEIPAPAVTGIFGSQTQAAVEAFQAQFGIPVTGVVLATTWDAIADLYNDLVQGSRLREGQYPGFAPGEEQA